jgi:F-type H+-transporting ATPase subunit alpha
MKLELAQFRELQAFASFGSDLDKTTLGTLERGRRLTELLKQPQYEPRPLWAEVAAIYATTNGYLDGIPVNKVQAWESGFLKMIELSHPDIVNAIMNEKRLSDDTIAKLKSAIEMYNKSFS